MGSLFQELKRRNVYKVATVYVVISWVLLQVSDTLFPAFEIPDNAIRILAVVLFLGFPLVVGLAWAFDITPEGIKKTEAPLPGEQTTLRKRDYLFSALLVILAGVVVSQQLILISRPVGEVVAAAIDDKSIAVLPFADFSPTGDQQWFSDGLAEEILNALVRTPDLNVASRTSSFAFKDSNLEVTEIARALEVGYILEGSVRRSDTRLRITAQLIRAVDGFHLWSENYDRTPNDAIAIQEDLAISISRALQTAMDPEALATMVEVGTESVLAYNAYLEGLAIQPCGGSPACMEPLERAIRIDPEFADAQYQLALQWFNQMTLTRMRAFRGIGQAAMRENFQRHITEAIVSANNPVDLLKYRAKQAEANLQLANRVSLLEEYTQARPNDSTGWISLANAYYQMGNSQSAQEAMRQGIVLVGGSLDREPNILGQYYRFDTEASVELARRILIETSMVSAQFYQAHRTLLWAGELELASEAARLFLQNPNLGDLTDDVGTAYNIFILQLRQACAEGRDADANQLYEAAQPMENPSYEWLALTALGRDQEAENLLRAYDTPETLLQLYSWYGYPQFDPRPFPELMAVLEREGVNLPPVRKVPFACGD